MQDTPDGVSVNSEDLREFAQAVVWTRQMDQEVISSRELASAVALWELDSDLVVRIGRVLGACA